jgi:tellurite resistance protein TehA-like permease
MPDDKNFFAGLFDFSFHQVLARRIVKVLYIIGILAGGIYVVARVVVGFQQSPADGLIALVAGIVCLFVGILIWRVLLELVLVALRISDSIDRATRAGN